jgi:hypothetical protein
MAVKLTRGKYKFRDISTGKNHIISSTDATSAVSKLNKKLGKKVNYSFIGFKK